MVKTVCFRSHAVNWLHLSHLVVDLFEYFNVYTVVKNWTTHIFAIIWSYLCIFK